MWHSFEPSRSTIEFNFGLYLESTEHQEFQARWAASQQSDVPSVLDIVENWLSHPNYCEDFATLSFQDLLITILGWVDEWAGSGGTYVYGNPLWEIDGEAKPTSFVQPLSSEDVKEFAHSLLSPTLFQAQHDIAWMRCIQAAAAVIPETQPAKQRKLGSKSNQ